MTLIVYGTKYGSTEEALEILLDNLEDKDVKIVNISKEKTFKNLDNFDKVIIGGPINGGRLNGYVKKFIQDNLKALLNTKLAIFITHLETATKANSYFKLNFPEELLEKAVCKGCFGGALYFERLSFLERFILKAITRSDKNIWAINKKNIEEFANVFNKIK